MKYIPAYMKENTLFKPSIIKSQSNYGPLGRESVHCNSPPPLCGQPYFTHPAGARM